MSFEARLVCWTLALLCLWLANQPPPSLCGCLRINSIRSPRFYPPTRLAVRSLCLLFWCAVSRRVHAADADADALGRPASRCLCLMAHLSAASSPTACLAAQLGHLSTHVPIYVPTGETNRQRQGLT